MSWIGKEWCNPWVFSHLHSKNTLSHSNPAEIGQPLDSTGCWAIKQGAERCGSTGACLDSEVDFVFLGPRVCLVGLALACMMTSRSHSKERIFLAGLVGVSYVLACVSGGGCVIRKGSDKTLSWSRDLPGL